MSSGYREQIVVVTGGADKGYREMQGKDAEQYEEG